MTAWRSDRRWLTTARRSMVNESEVFDGDEREIEDQKFMIRPGLGESKTAEGFLRDIEMILLSGQVSKNLDQHMFARTYRSKKCSWRIDNKKLTIPRFFVKSKIAKESLSKI